MNKWIVLCLGLFSVFSAVFAQGFQEPEVLTAQMSVLQPQVSAGGEFQIAVIVDIHHGLHINSNKPAQEYLIPAEFKFTPAADVSFGAVLYPQPLSKPFAFSDEPLSVYEDKIQINARAQVAPSAALGIKTIEGVFSYQGCNDNSCFAPDEIKLSAQIEVVAAGTAITAPLAPSFTDETDPAPASVQFTQDERRALEILEQGLPYAILAFFLIGLALNLTPCVYPVIPLTVSYFGGQSSKSRGSSFISALFYLIGIALSFALLGVLSGLAGKQWGFLFQSPWFVVVIAGIILLMAASMFGAFEISVPSGLLTRFGGAREGILGALIMGLTVGVIIAPCAAGIIIGLVGLVAKLGLVVKGGILFFVMGLGLGLPYLILATFSGLLNRMPQSGMWMIWVKKFFGFLLIGVALYFITPQLERINDKLSFLVGLVALVAGVLLGFLDHDGGYGKGFKWFRHVAGVILLLLGFFMVRSGIEAKVSELPWQPYRGQTVEQLLEAQKPVFMDFYADWCAPCKQLERETFSDARVVEAFAGFTLVKVDCTKPDAQTRAWMEKFAVSGMPTLIFLNTEGEEIKSLREIGFVGPDKFLESLKAAVE